MTEACKVNSGTLILVGACRSLRDMAHAFRATGNEAHAGWLERMADGVEDGLRKIRGESGQDAGDGADGPPGGGPPSAPYWDRLAWDRDISGTSPVVRGTWVTASRVVSRIVDGMTWSDILRDHPELTTDDIRACLAYTVAQEPLL